MSGHIHRVTRDEEAGDAAGTVVEIHYDYHPATAEHDEEVVLMGVLPVEQLGWARDWFYNNVTMLGDEAREE